MNEHSFRASSPADVEHVAQMVEGTPEHLRTGLAAFFAWEGLMVPQMWVRVIFWIVRRRKDGMARMFYIFARFPEMVDQLLDGAAAHIRTGKDREDLSSVGGFSQREMNLLADFWRNYVNQDTAS